MIIREYLMSKNKLNLYDDSKSLFSPDKYSIEVDCDWDKPCCFISSKGKQWKLKVCIDTYEILEIVRNGVITSNNSDEFQNIINKLELKKNLVKLQNILELKLLISKDK